MTPTWTDADLIRAAKARPLTPERLAKVQKRCSSGQWERILPQLQAYAAASLIGEPRQVIGDFSRPEGYREIEEPNG